MNTRQSHLQGRVVYIIDGCRTPFLKARNKPGPFRASDLAVAASRNLLLRMPFEPQQLDEVIFGCVGPGPDEANIARVIALRLGCGERVPAMTVQRNCASGMQAVDSAALNIASGRADLVLAGGTEAMSHYPVLLDEAMVTWLGKWNDAHTLSARGKALAQFRLQMLKPVFTILRGLTDPVIGMSMGQTAEKLAYEYQITRSQMDEFSVRSHQRLRNAIDKELLNEIVPLYDDSGHSHVLDNGLRRDSSVEKLATLGPVFDRPTGMVTAGNSAQVTDGAACLLLASSEAVRKHGLPVLGRIIDSHWAGLDPARMGLGPVYAMAPLLKRNQLQSGDIDYWEINEAFSAQVLACLSAWTDNHLLKDELGMDSSYEPIPADRLNVDGGGISLGHPLGASGARIILHLLKVLERNSAQRGVASLCVGGGQGGAVLVERN